MSITFKPMWLCCTLVIFDGQHESNPFEQGFGRRPHLERSFNTLSLKSSLKAQDLGEQLVFSSLEIPDAC